MKNENYFNDSEYECEDYGLIFKVYGLNEQSETCFCPNCGSGNLK